MTANMCPKTYFDLVAEIRPSIVANMTALVAEKPIPAASMTTDDIASMIGGMKEIDEILRQDLIDFGRFNLTLQGRHGLARSSEKEVIDAIPSNIVNGHMEKIGVEMTLIANFVQHGKKAYFFSENLVERLADTEMNVDEQIVTLPFTSCVFVYDCQTVRDAVAKVWKGVADTKGTVSVFMNMFSEEDGSRSIAMAPIVHDGYKVGALVSRSLHLRPGGTVEEALDTDWVKVNGEESGHATIADRHFATAGRRMARIFINSALYLASSNPDIVPGMRQTIDPATSMGKKQRRTAERILGQQTSLSYTYVGGATQKYDRDGSGSGHPLESRIRVQGHWKTQAHGKAHALRKVIHIEPYWRGPDMAEVVNRPHVVR